MVFTVDTCAGPTAFAGPVSTYYEVVTKDFKRLHDGEWSRMLRGAAAKPELEAWMESVLE